MPQVFERYKFWISDLLLRRSLDRLVFKIQKGFFNIIIVWGPTRTGKSTLGAQMGKHMSEALGKPFDERNMFWDTEKLVEEAMKGKRDMVYMLDEAAFDMMGEDWQKQSHKDFIKIIFTAAKYHQTFIICIPVLEKLREAIVTDNHTVGLEVYYNEKTFQRGFFKIYKKSSLSRYYKALKKGKYINFKYIKTMRGTFSARFDDFINRDHYEEMKDNAIKALGKKDKNKGTDKKQIIRKLLSFRYRPNKTHMTHAEIGKIVGLQASTISNESMQFKT